MKTKILIWGAGIFAKKFLEDCLDNERAELLAFVETVKSKDEFEGHKVISGAELKDYSYDYVVVISSYLNEIRESLLEHQIDLNICFFTSDIHNWSCHKRNISALMNILRDDYIQNGFKLIIENKTISSYAIMETSDGLTFCGNYSDDIIGEMIDTGNVYSNDEIDAFFDLSEKFYDIESKKGGGYFFDCGCNILTSAIYALHKRKSLKAVGFEPVKRTYRIAKANAALNDMDERITVVNKGLSDHDGIAQMKCSQYSCGGNYIIADRTIEDESIDVVQMTTLDKWIAENSFDMEKIDYLWIDTEGYEGYALKGMMTLLSKKKIPMYLEYYTDLLSRSGSKELLLECLEKVYSRYIVVRRGGIFDLAEIHSVSELRKVKEMNDNIFLIP